MENWILLNWKKEIIKQDGKHDPFFAKKKCLYVIKIFGSLHYTVLSVVITGWYENDIFISMFSSIFFYISIIHRHCFHSKRLFNFLKGDQHQIREPTLAADVMDSTHVNSWGAGEISRSTTQSPLDTLKKIPFLKKVLSWYENSDSISVIPPEFNSTSLLKILHSYPQYIHLTLE